MTQLTIKRSYPPHHIFLITQYLSLLTLPVGSNVIGKFANDVRYFLIYDNQLGLMALKTSKYSSQYIVCFYMKQFSFIRNTSQ